MIYQMNINSTESISTAHTTGDKEVKVLLEVGRIYEVVINKPKNKKDRNNKGRIVEVLGFTADYWGDVVVRYKDNNRRGRVHVNCLLPFTENR